MPSNQAAWIDAKNQRLEVRAADMPVAGPHEIILRNYALAVNPVDWKMQEGHFLDSVGLPFVLGCDAAGEVVEVGSAVERFKKGDRVLAHCISLATKRPQSAAFQHFSAADARMASRIPAHLSFTDAAVLPIAISTAAGGLYSHDTLALPLPLPLPLPATATTASSSSPRSPHQKKKKKKKQAVVIWGGSSSVGVVAIQLAKASGLAVVTTASAHNLAALRSDAGADYAFDYSRQAADRLVEDMVGAVAELQARGYEFGGVFDAISVPSTFAVLERLFDALEAKGLLATVVVVEEEEDEGKGQGAGTKSNWAKAVKKMTIVLPVTEGLPKGVEIGRPMAALLHDKYPEVAGAIWGDFVFQALARGVLKALPPAEVVGTGLGALQTGLDRQREGVTYRKIVVEL